MQSRNSNFTRYLPGFLPGFYHRRIQSLLLILVVLLMFVFVPPVQSQSIEMGMKMGVTSSGMTRYFEPCSSNGNACPATTHSDGSYQSISGGITFGMEISPRFSLQSELLYLSKGYTETTPTLQFSYLEAPFLLRYELSSQTNRFYLQAGPTVSVELSCSVSFRTTDEYYRGNCQDESQLETDFTSSRVDVGAVLGGGFSFGQWNVLEIRYTRGLRDVQPMNTSSRSNHYVFGVYTGFTVPLNQSSP